MALRKLTNIQPHDVSFTVDLRRHRITAAFGVSFTDPRQFGDGHTEFVSDLPVGKYNRKNRYMFQIPFGQLKDIKEVCLDGKSKSLAITLESPPQYYRKREDPTAGHTKENTTWSEFDTWYRQTDIVYDPFRLAKAKVALQKDVPVIDIGKDAFSHAFSMI
jgi:RNA-dependent RNA polymerase